MWLSFKNILIILSLSLCFIGSGCIDIDTVYPDELENYQSKPVVNGLMESGAPFSLQLTSSASLVEDEQPKLIKNAVITLGINGVNQVMAYDDNVELYLSSYTPSPGDVVELDLRANGFPIATATERIPASIQAVSELIPEGGKDTSGFLSDLLKIRFQDDGSSKNYYKIQFLFYDETLGQFLPMAFNSNDPSLAEYNSFKLNDGGIIFTDELFNGKQKELSTVAPFGLVISNPDEKYLIQLESLSESYYRYLVSLQRARDAGEATFISAFNSAVVIYSNINNGLGILGSTYAEKDTLR